MRLAYSKIGGRYEGGFFSDRVAIENRGKFGWLFEVYRRGRIIGGGVAATMRQAKKDADHTFFVLEIK